jgi:hypothetical protein
MAVSHFVSIDDSSALRRIASLFLASSFCIHMQSRGRSQLCAGTADSLGDANAFRDINDTSDTHFHDRRCDSVRADQRPFRKVSAHGAAPPTFRVSS